MKTFGGLSEFDANGKLAGWLNARGFRYNDDENAAYSLDSHEDGLVVYVMFQGSYSCNVVDIIPCFSHSLDSFHFVVEAMNATELVTYRQHLIRKQNGQGLGEGAIDATAAQRTYAALHALGFLK